ARPADGALHELPPQRCFQSPKLAPCHSIRKAQRRCALRQRPFTPDRFEEPHLRVAEDEAVVLQHGQSQLWFQAHRRMRSLPVYTLRPSAFTNPHSVMLNESASSTARLDGAPTA